MGIPEVRESDINPRGKNKNKNKSPQYNEDTCPEWKWSGVTYLSEQQNPLIQTIELENQFQFLSLWHLSHRRKTKVLQIRPSNLLFGLSFSLALPYFSKYKFMLFFYPYLCHSLLTKICGSAFFSFLAAGSYLRTWIKLFILPHSCTSDHLKT